jgi:protease-4
LVDQLGGLDDAIKTAAEMAGLKEYRVVKLPELTDPFTEMLKGGSHNVRAWVLKKELGNAWEYFDNINRLSRMDGIYARMPFNVYIR